jgi:antitoxin component of MazEF toxin-antitoxin module
MLKKLVKYGNSNALVLDKAILELLDIEEGSIVKIKTDGKAIIITAQQVNSAKEKLTPILTHHDALKEASIKEMLKQYKHLDKAQKELFAEEFSLYHNKLENNAAHVDKKVQEITEENPDTSSNEYLTQINDLRNSSTAKRTIILQEMGELPNKHGLPTLTKEQMANMQADFTEHFKKHAATQTKVAQIINDQKYMHEMQLLAEKYADNPENSAEYIKATRELMWKFVPEMRQADEEMAAISKKYDSIK